MAKNKSKKLKVVCISGEGVNDSHGLKAIKSRAGEHCEVFGDGVTKLSVMIDRAVAAVKGRTDEDTLFVINAHGTNVEDKKGNLSHAIDDRASSTKTINDLAVRVGHKINVAFQSCYGGTAVVTGELSDNILDFFALSSSKNSTYGNKDGGKVLRMMDGVIAGNSIRQAASTVIKTTGDTVYFLSANRKHITDYQIYSRAGKFTRAEIRDIILVTVPKKERRRIFNLISDKMPENERAQVSYEFIKRIIDFKNFPKFEERLKLLEGEKIRNQAEYLKNRAAGTELDSKGQSWALSVSDYFKPVLLSDLTIAARDYMAYIRAKKEEVNKPLYRSSDGYMPPLFFAIKENSIEKMKELDSLKADFASKTTHFQDYYYSSSNQSKVFSITPIECAAFYKSYDAFRFLLVEKGVKFDLSELVTKDGSNFLEKALDFFIAKDDEVALAKILENAKEQEIDWLLLDAFKAGPKMKAVKFFIEKGATPNLKYFDKEGGLLHYLIQNRHFDLALQLMKNFKTKYGKEFYSLHQVSKTNPLILAINSGDKGLIDEILSIHKESRYPQSVTNEIIYAINNSDLNMLDILINAGIEFDLGCAFLKAGAENNYTVFKYLAERFVDAIKENQDFLNVKDDDGRDAAWHAIKNGNLEIFKVLVESGVKIDSGRLSDVMSEYYNQEIYDYLQAKQVELKDVSMRTMIDSINNAIKKGNEQFVINLFSDQNKRDAFLRNTSRVSSCLVDPIIYSSCAELLNKLIKIEPKIAEYFQKVSEETLIDRIECSKINASMLIELAKCGNKQVWNLQLDKLKFGEVGKVKTFLHNSEVLAGSLKSINGSTLKKVIKLATDNPGIIECADFIDKPLKSDDSKSKATNKSRPVLARIIKRMNDEVGNIELLKDNLDLFLNSKNLVAKDYKGRTLLDVVMAKAFESKNFISLAGQIVLAMEERGIKVNLQDSFPKKSFGTFESSYNLRKREITEAVEDLRIEVLKRDDFKNDKPERESRAPRDSEDAPSASVAPKSAAKPKTKIPPAHTR